MPSNSNIDYGWVARLAINRPRLAVLLNLAWDSFAGGVVGLFVGLSIFFFTTCTQDRFLIYAFSTLMVLMFRILGQSMWLMQLRPQVPNYLGTAMEMHGLERDENRNVPLDESSRISLTPAILVTVGAATILATEEASHMWMSEFPGNVVIPLVAGMITAPLNALVTPSVLNTLLRGHYHEVANRDS